MMRQGEAKQGEAQHKETRKSMKNAYVRRGRRKCVTHM
jgi:hypothetical protein